MRVPAPARQAADAVVEARDRALEAPTHDERTAAILGVALGACFLICFSTGLLSHAIQHPPGWFHWPPRPAYLYRITQGLHIATGLATIPLLLAKLWSVFPQLAEWPPLRSAAHLVERALLVPLVCGSVFLLFSGTASIAHWYPWRFSFTTSHYWVAWMTIGALIAHTGAKFATARRELGRAGRARARVRDRARDRGAPTAEGTLSRRGFVGWAFGASGLVVLTTAGQTVPFLRPFTLFAPRRPDIGPQGLPVNARASAQVRELAADPGYRLRVRGAVERELSLTLDELRALPQHHADLAIACVEGWSASAHWSGVPMRDLLALAGVPADRAVTVTVRSLQTGSRYARSELSNAQARDRDTLVALAIDGEPLHPDHGFPCRLVGPNRPGVHQTKWLTEVVVA
jgi:DMSO/TMAO reductase YedYZ molybdopterin-dependent catalytic subunit